MKRREFITFLGGGVAAWPFVARAQQPERMRRIGMLVNFAEDDPEARRRIAAFQKSMSELSWVDGKNVRTEYRWGVDAQVVAKNAAELVALAPDVIVANAPPPVQALKQATHTIPLVFVAVTDPVALGIVQSLARPGGNVTGFSPAEFGLSAKWLQLLKEIAPDVKRVAVFEDPRNSGGLQQFATLQTAAPSMGVDLSVIDVRDADKIEREVEAFASSGGSGLIVLRTSEDIAVRDVIIAAAARHRLPTVYPLRFMATGGGPRVVRPRHCR